MKQVVKVDVRQYNKGERGSKLLSNSACPEKDLFQCSCMCLSRVKVSLDGFTISKAVVVDAVIHGTANKDGQEKRNAINHKEKQDRM